MIDLKQLYWDGIVPAGMWEGVGEFKRDLAFCAQYPGHVVAHGDGRPLVLPMGAPVSCFAPRDVLAAPGFFSLATSFLPVAEKYLGVEPRLYSVNAFWTRPTKEAPNPHIQQWHRDRDDLKFLVLFLYGTDVLDVTEGPHAFAIGTHRHNDLSNRPPTPIEDVKLIFGPAGTMILADTRGIHMGYRPFDTPRLIAWARFGVSEKPVAYGWDRTEPVPASSLALGDVDKDVQRMTRLIVDWEK